MSQLSDELTEVVTRLKTDSEITNKIVHGDKDTEVATNSGVVKSFAKTINDFEKTYSEQSMIDTLDTKVTAAESASTLSTNQANRATSEADRAEDKANEITSVVNGVVKPKNKQVTGNYSVLGSNHGFTLEMIDQSIQTVTLPASKEAEPNEVDAPFEIYIEANPNYNVNVATPDDTTIDGETTFTVTAGMTIRFILDEDTGEGKPFNWNAQKFGTGVGNGQSEQQPLGAIVPFAGSVPTSYIKLLNTRKSLVKSQYPDLSSELSSAGYPWGSTPTHFNIPSVEDVNYVSTAVHVEKVGPFATTKSSTTTLPHSLGKVPDDVSFVAICTQANESYAVGDTIVIPSLTNDASYTRDYTVEITDADITLRFGASTDDHWITSIRDDFAAAGLNHGRWEITATCKTYIQTTTKQSYGIKAFNTSSSASNVDLDELTAMNNLPVGSLIQTLSSTPSNGFLPCDGSLYDRTLYADLFEVIGEKYGAGDGSTTFAVPNKGGKTINEVTTTAQPANNGSFTFVHTLGVVPSIFKIYARCTTTSQGYAVGDIVEITHIFSNAHYGGTISANAQNVFINMSSVPVLTGPSVTDVMTVAHWELFAYAAVTDGSDTYVHIKATDPIAQSSGVTTEDILRVAHANRVPVGTIIASGQTADIDGWRKLIDDGEDVSREDFKNLFAAIGTRYGEGDSATTFGLPSSKDALLGSSSYGVIKQLTTIVNNSTSDWAYNSSYYTINSDGSFTRKGSSYNFSCSSTSARLVGDFEYSYVQEDRTADGSGLSAAYCFGMNVASTANTGGTYTNNNNNDLYFAHAGVGSNQTITVGRGQTVLHTLTNINIQAGDKFAWKRNISNFELWKNNTKLVTVIGYTSDLPMYPLLGHGGSSYAPISHLQVSWSNPSELVQSIDTDFYIKTHDPLVTTSEISTNELLEEVRKSRLPIGARVPFATDPGIGWLEENGQVVSRDTYKALFNRIGTMYGEGDGSTTFQVANISKNVKSLATVTGTMSSNHEAVRDNNYSQNYLESANGGNSASGLNNNITYTFTDTHTFTRAVATPPTDYNSFLYSNNNVAKQWLIQVGTDNVWTTVASGTSTGVVDRTFEHKGNQIRFVMEGNGSNSSCIAEFDAYTDPDTKTYIKAHDHLIDETSVSASAILNEVKANKLPIGARMSFDFDPGAFWLKEDGAAVSRTVYAGLFTKLGTKFGVGDGSTTFNLKNSIYTTKVSHSDGTNFGDMTDSGGVAVAFNGVLGTTNTQCAKTPSANSKGYLGKHFSKPKYISNVRVYAHQSSSYGIVWNEGSFTTLTIDVYGSNTSPSSQTDGTLLGTYSGPDIVNSYVDIVTSTNSEWAYSWIALSSDEATNYFYIAEVEFTETSEPTYIKALDGIEETKTVATDTLLEAVNEVKTDLESVKTDLESSGVVKEISSCTSNGTWSISGLTPYKPLIIGIDCTTYGWMKFRVTGGSVFGSCNSGYYYSLASYNDLNNATSPSTILIPTSSTVTLDVIELGQTAKAKAFQ